VQAPYKGRDRQIVCREHDLVAIPADIPALGVRAGDKGIVRGLDLHDNAVVASVRVDYSTHQPRGWVDMEIKPDSRVLSYTTDPAAR
jgi:hypothetical protein